jgi:hypothetical protein
MKNDQIREIFIANGFTVKEGQTDLKPYVYAAARALLEAALKPGNVASKTRNPKYPWKPSHGWDKCMKCFEDFSMEPCNHCGGGYPDQYLDSSPAQTPPPRLETQDVVRLKRTIQGTLDVQFVAFARAIETAVRAQFGVQE